MFPNDKYLGNYRTMSQLRVSYYSFHILHQENSYFPGVLDNIHRNFLDMELAQQLRSLVALAEDMGSVPNNHTVPEKPL